ncbi:nitroreductase [Solemya pervernicosa gill symbiont]|uniref:Nitroreductase n=2 Tax=Gammaproteobacteria incertae sedis TaxID=118884 RepID=A0A1T2L6G2_9GAMM|nr:nitroreductase family protein [Candidatus Reidiella endopervernicosa]OOZ40526.1 nitroreductase [Solemya pervernicosa gill symbiont]QKQ27512.1 nitroreductase family protein [Candidatus Reidiella endopervernicosa]
MWDFFETVHRRHSVRKYQSDMPVEADKLHAILETACAAPSAGDLQSYRIIQVEQAETRARLSAAAGDQDFLQEAPVLLVFCADPLTAGKEYGERGETLYAIQDTTIAAAYAQLAAVAAGMASAWVGYFDEQQVIDALQLDVGLKPVAIIAIGYPAELPAPTPRRPIDEVVTQFPG